MFLFLHKPLLEYPSYIKYFYNNIIYASYIIVKMEGITYWFFSGSDYMPNLKSSPQMNEKILQINKR